MQVQTMDSSIFLLISVIFHWYQHINIKIIISQNSQHLGPATLWTIVLERDAMKLTFVPVAAIHRKGGTSKNAISFGASRSITLRMKTRIDFQDNYLSHFSNKY